MGVRISWLMLAKNSLFARFAACAASSACRRSIISPSSLRFTSRKASRCMRIFKVRWMKTPKMAAPSRAPMDVRTGDRRGWFLGENACNNPNRTVATNTNVPMGAHSSLNPGWIISNARAAAPMPSTTNPTAVCNATRVRLPNAKAWPLPHSMLMPQAAPTAATTNPGTPSTGDRLAGGMICDKTKPPARTRKQRAVAGDMRPESEVSVVM